MRGGGTDINAPSLPPMKTEIDVAADYLIKLRQAMRVQLQKTLGEDFNREERNIRYLLTVPGIWDDVGKEATRQAAIQAGFLRDEYDNRLTLITEPEAAAMFCSKAGLLNLKLHDAVLIVNCGGGTELIAYEVEEGSPFTLVQRTAGTGDVCGNECGAMAIDRYFRNILGARIRKMNLPDGSRTAGKVYRRCIMDFDNRIKAGFGNYGHEWIVDVGLESQFPEAGIENGYMTFTNNEILQCFEPVVNRVLDLVRNQIIVISLLDLPLQVRIPCFPFVILLFIFFGSIDSRAYSRLTTSHSRTFWWSVIWVLPSIYSNKSNYTSHHICKRWLFALGTLSPLSLRELSLLVLLKWL